MKHFLSAIIATVLSLPASAGTIEAGPAIDAAQLAKHLNVFAYSLTYKHERPFKSLFFALTFKERRPNGDYVTAAKLVIHTYPFVTPRTEISLTIFLDSQRSTVASDNFSLTGKGFPISPRYSTGTPPQLRPGGGYILLRTVSDQNILDTEESTQGVLELELKPIE